MPTKVYCPHCDRPLRLPEALYDQSAECPRCGGAFTVRWHQRPRGEVLDALPAEAVVEPARKPCRYCGQPIRPEAVKCPHCREWLDGGKSALA